jgi:type IV pilus assembly protein PilY1
MSILRILRLAALLFGGAMYATVAPAAAATPAVQTAGDIDIFLGTSGGTASAANVMFLIDNSANWSKASQHWPDAPTQGQAEVAAIRDVVLPYLLAQGEDINVGLAMLSTNAGSSGSGGGYIRFGARNMNVAQNNVALQNILTIIYNNINGPDEKINQSSKDETAGLYEVYKYFSGLAPYTGQLLANPYADVALNTGGGPLGASGVTAFAQGLGSGWAIGTNGLYQSPINANAPCAANYIIYIANNASGSASTGPFENVYEPAVVPALTALPNAPAGGGDTWTDEWTRFFYQSGAQVPAGNNNGSITTYVLDAYNAQDNVSYSASLNAAGHQGGGGYFQVSSQAAIGKILLKIFEQIQSVNSTFASASLPVNATNRAQDENQVFVPMFRPDSNLQPRWFGNLKQFQLINSGGLIVLGDGHNPSQPAINPLTGFPTSCSKSIWTTTSQDLVNYPNGYWNYTMSLDATLGVWNATPETTAAKGTCPTATHGAWDDNPDGSLVEKGGVAEVIRKGNNPSVTNLSPTWSPSGRTVLTTDNSNNIVSFNTGHTGLPAALVNWVNGQDVQDENGNGNGANGTSSTETRPSVHGDEIHSRPLPIDYGSGTVRVFYGSNDGTLRAVDGGTGQELWAFVPREFYTPAPTVYVPGQATPAVPTGLERLMWSGMQDPTNPVGYTSISPVINYFSTPPGVLPAPAFKDYYYDGSISVYEGPTNASGNPTPIWIYPSMRRGGRMLYGLNVTNVNNPAVLWKFGCPDQGDNSNCVPASGTNVTSIGQTWSIPAVTASVMGYSNPVVIVGGGYDTCEDYNTQNPSTTTNPSTSATYCPATQKGAGVFVLDAQTGTQVAFFATSGGSVASDVALISVTTPGVVDHAYAADTRGNIWRIDFGSNVSHWVMNRVAYTTGAGRKFLFAPALLAAPGNQVYVALGSGDREHPLQAEYPYSNVLNRFYVFKDNLSSTSALNLDGASMEDFTFDAGDPGPGGNTSGTSCSTAGVLPTTTAYNGWFIDLNANGQGEQVVTSALIAAGMVAFSTNRPIPQATGTCASTLGAAYGYWLNLFNASGGISATGQACGGLRDSPFVGGGLPPSPVTASVPVGGQVVQAVIGAAQLNGGTNCGICPQQVQPSIIPTRTQIFWKASGEN